MKNKIVTSCRDCKFAQFDGKTQVGCQFDLLNKYRLAGIDIIEAYDEDKEFSVISRICMFSRHKSHPATLEEVREATRVHYQVIYVIDSDNIDDFSFCLQSIINQDIKPQHITVIRPFDINVPPFQYTKRLVSSGIKWRYQDSTNPELDTPDLVDIAIDAVKYPFYVILSKAIRLPQEFSTELDLLVNDKFTIFSALIGANIEIIPTIHHTQLGGNSFQRLVDKMNEEKQLKDKIYHVGDMLPCLR